MLLSNEQSVKGRCHFPEEKGKHAKELWECLSPGCQRLIISPDTGEKPNCKKRHLCKRYRISKGALSKVIDDAKNQMFDSPCFF